MVPYEYNKGIYALPETMDFTVMYYRKDIMKELGLKLPNTWTEVYEDLLPRLYENGMQFNYLSGLAPLLFQNGGEFYNAMGTKSGLDSPEAFKAFKDWTEMNTNYGIPVESNFFTRMRSGEMPIGVASYSHYMQLATSAPELYGRWDIAPVPGTKRADGTIDRSVSTIASQAAIIMKQSKHQEEAWEFLKWWTSTDTQMRFGRELEALLGVEARWNTANKEAFQGLPWKKEHLKIIMDQLKWAKEQPIVLGGYFTTRHITNAWNRVALSNVDPRDSLEQAVKDINKELRTKQEEYGYKPE
jgi:ABC-type glycerol-3-phosphate transport system substrate-binding protein